MTAFRAAAYLMPIAAGLVVPAVIAWTRERRLRVAASIAAPVASFLGLSLVLLVFWFFSGDAFSAFLKVLALSAGLCMLLTGLFFFLRLALRFPPVAAQILSGLALVLIAATVFALGPIVRDAHERGLTGGVIEQRITRMISVSPYVVTAYSIFGDDDVLRRPFLYATDAADYAFAVPAWPRAAGTFAFTGILLFLLSLPLHAVWKKLSSGALEMPSEVGCL
ncbi:MAG: hypothetical protein ACYTAF_02645 [Planctomycetota bacterium]|jgi:hypothetical protein